MSAEPSTLEWVVLSTSTCIAPPFNRSLFVSRAFSEKLASEFQRLDAHEKRQSQLPFACAEHISRYCLAMNPYDAGCTDQSIRDILNIHSEGSDISWSS